MMQPTFLLSLFLTIGCQNGFGVAFSSTAGWSINGPSTLHRSSVKVALNMVDSSSNDEGIERTSSLNRRAAILKSITGLSTIAAVATASFPVPAYAKTPKEPITAETVADAFNAVRYELEDPNGGAAYLEQKISEQDFAAVLEFTKYYDLEFRKAKMGRARKLLTDKTLKDEAVLICNAVTFDLIGINRASRSGQQNAEEAMKYLGEMKADIRKFLDLESTIVIPADGS